MGRPLYEIGQRVAVYCATYQDVCPAATVVDRTHCRENEPVSLNGEPLLAIGGWYYGVDAAPRAFFHEHCLRPIDDDEYQEPEQQSNSLKTPNHEEQTA